MTLGTTERLSRNVQTKCKPVKLDNRTIEGCALNQTRYNVLGDHFSYFLGSSNDTSNLYLLAMCTNFSTNSNDDQ